MSRISSARLVLGVSGGIAVYKAADLASQLVQAGARVDIVMTPSAQEFVRPLTFQVITKRPVHTGVFEAWTETSFGHITLARQADLLIIAPVSANTIARLALGFADDMLGAVALATTAPLLLAPAMEHGMYHHPATQAHLATLRSRGAEIVGPESGRLASGYQGDGRLAAVDAIVGAVRAVLGRDGPLAGKRLVVTAGGTREPLDPVRFLGNRSSGLMGYALAQAAIDRGGAVTLVTGPTHLPVPYGAEGVHVETAQEMYGAVHRAVPGADALIAVAAVADFRPDAAREHKIKKQAGQETITIELARTPDILASIDLPGLVKIGFAAETEDLLDNACAKLEAKKLAMVVANGAVATIGSQDSTAVIIRRGFPPEHMPRMPKGELAAAIVDRLLPLLAARSSKQSNSVL